MPKISPPVEEVWTAFHLNVGVASGYTHLITSGDYSSVDFVVVIIDDENLTDSQLPYVRVRSNYSASLAIIIYTLRMYIDPSCTASIAGQTESPTRETHVSDSKRTTPEPACRPW